MEVCARAALFILAINDKFLELGQIPTSANSGSDEHVF